MELFGVVGFYQSVSLMMNADRYPMARPDAGAEAAAPGSAC
jgi:hypothetical protein